MNSTQDSTIDGWTTDGPSLDQRTILLVRGLGLRLVFCTSSPIIKYQKTKPNQRGIDWPTGRWLPTVGWAVLDSFSQQFGSFLKDPWRVLGDVFLDISNPKMILFDFITSHMNFIQNEHVKLDKTCIDTQGCFKANLSNVMDILGRLTSKLHEIWHAD